MHTLCWSGHFETSSVPQGHFKCCVAQRSTYVSLIKLICEYAWSKNLISPDKMTLNRDHGYKGNVCRLLDRSRFPVCDLKKEVYIVVALLGTLFGSEGLRRLNCSLAITCLSYTPMTVQGTGSPGFYNVLYGPECQASSWERPLPSRIILDRLD